MDDALARLLETEKRAEAIAQKADQEREAQVQQSLEQARLEEERFNARIPEIQQSYTEKATQKADQAIAELRRKHQERHAKLREIAETREAEALEAAFKLLLEAKD